MFPREHRELTGFDNDRVFSFFSYLEKMGKPVRIRHVVVPGITYDEEQLAALGRFLKGKTNIESVELLSYHAMGAQKYKSMGLPYPLAQTEPLTKEELTRAYEIVNENRNA